MKKLTAILFTFLLLMGLIGCGGKADQGKEDDKKGNKQTAEVKQQDKFNHSASMKITQIASQVPEIQDPLVVVYNKEGILAYKTEGESNAADIEKKIKRKLKAQMPDYQIHVNSSPEWYSRVAILHQDTIDSEGRVVKDLKKTFIQLKDIK